MDFSLGQKRKNGISAALCTPKGIEKRTSFRFYVVSLSANHCEYIKRIGNMLSVEELNDRLIDLAFCRRHRRWRPHYALLYSGGCHGKIKLLIKEEGVLAGMEIAMEVFRRFDPDMKVEVFIQDGTHVKPGDVAMIVTGRVRSLLQTERLMLNIMQRMSGIATMTNKYVERLKGTNTCVGHA